MAILGLAARKNREIAGCRSPGSGAEDMCLWEQKQWSGQAKLGPVSVITALDLA